MDLKELIRREIFDMNERDNNHEDELTNFVNPDEIRDGGYAWNAITPPTVGEAEEPSISSSPVNDYKNIQQNLLTKIIRWVESNFELGDLTNFETLKKIYMVNSQNIDRILPQAKNGVEYYDKLLKIKDFLSSKGLINEDLTYSHVSDASPDSDEYEIVTENIDQLSQQDSDALIAKIFKTLKLGDVRPDYIGSGDYGRAYAYGDKVYKLTTDNSEAMESSALKGKNNRTIADIYNTYQFEHNGNDLYLIILEKLDTTNIARNFEYLEEYAKQGLSESLYELVRSYVEDKQYYDKVYAEPIVDLLGNSEFARLYNGILGIADELKVNGIKTYDYLNPKNLGYKKDGTVGFFDIGSSKRETFSKRPQLLGIGESLTLESEKILDEASVLLERIVSWMPKSKSVEVKKNCKLGGNGDGTSDACNQGDMANLELSDINDSNKTRRDDNWVNVAEDKENDRYYFDDVKKLTEGIGECENIKITDDIKRHVLRYDTDEKLLRSGGIPIKLLDDAAHGFNEDSFKTLMPNQLNIRWKDDLENVKHEIKHKGITDQEYARNVDLSEPIDVDYWKDEKMGFKEGFYIQDGHHRYYAALILNKPLNVNLEMKINPITKLTDLGYDDFHRCIWKQVHGKGINESVLKEEKVNYGALMLFFDLPNWEEKILSKINDDDLYDDGSGTFGKENEPHITALYGFHEKVGADSFNEIVENVKPIAVEANGITIFENEKFDVVKIDIKPTEELLKLRKDIETLPNTLTYKDYHPHMTLAYVKSGEGKKYVKEFSKPIRLTSGRLVYSDKNRKQTNFNLKK